MGCCVRAIAAKRVSSSSNCSSTWFSSSRSPNCRTVVGIIIAAAAVAWVAAHPDGHIEVHVALAVTGGPALYLLGVAAFKRTTGATYWPLSHLVGLGALAALALAAPMLQPWQIGIAVPAILIATAIWETISLRSLHIAHAAGEN